MKVIHAMDEHGKEMYIVVDKITRFYHDKAMDTTLVRMVGDMDGYYVELMGDQTGKLASAITKEKTI